MRCPMARSGHLMRFQSGGGGGVGEHKDGELDDGAGGGVGGCDGPAGGGGYGCLGARSER